MIWSPGSLTTKRLAFGECAAAFGECAAPLSENRASMAAAATTTKATNGDADFTHSSSFRVAFPAAPVEL